MQKDGMQMGWERERKNTVCVWSGERIECVGESEGGREKRRVMMRRGGEGRRRCGQQGVEPKLVYGEERW